MTLQDCKESSVAFGSWRLVTDRWVHGNFNNIGFTHHTEVDYGRSAGFARQSCLNSHEVHVKKERGKKHL